MKGTYEKGRESLARKAKSEFLEYVVAKPGPKFDDTMRAIDYLVKRMAFNTVVTEQVPCWLLGHMLAFARGEVRRARRGES
jgi:hypothetical protein